MSLLREIRVRFHSLFGRKALEEDMERELREHLLSRAERNREAGLAQDEAVLAATRAFGGVDQIKERCRDEWHLRWLSEFGQDARYAARMLRKGAGFTTVSVAVLALGIGVTTAMFSVIYGVLLSPYPYARSSEIWDPEVSDKSTGKGIGFDVGDYLEMAKLPAVQSAMATTFNDMNFTGDSGPQPVNAPLISGTAFQFLGVAPAVGRYFTPADVRPNGTPEPVVVLTYKVWQRMFNGSPDAVGRAISLNDRPYTVIGAMPDRFGWYTDDGLWLPMPTTDLHHYARPILRLKPGVSREVAEQQLNALCQRLAHEDPERFPKGGFTAKLYPYLERTSASGQMQESLDMLFCVVGILLLIACTNVANLQLARGSSRRREIAIRLALGARRGRIVRQLLTENMGIALAGGILGTALAYGIKQLVVALMPADYVPNEARVTINIWVLAFSFGVSVVTGIISGLAPALQSTRPDLNETLKDGGHGSGGAGAQGAATRNTLVVAEVALSIVLLVGASLAVRGLIELTRVERGFNPNGMAVLRVPLSAKRYKTLPSRNAFARELVSGLASLPGVETAAEGSLPGYDPTSEVAIPGQPKPPAFVVGLVSADYFRTFAMPLRDGVGFTAEQVAHGDHVAVINESARKYWLNGTNPIGHTLSITALVKGFKGGDHLPDNPSGDVTVIGIVPDTRPLNPKDTPNPVAFVPCTLVGNSHLTVFIRSRVPPAGLFNEYRAQLRKLDKDQAMLDPWTVDQIMDHFVEQPCFNMTLFSSFAGIALILAAAGVYSLLSYSVTQRTREIGVRIALGAEPGDILRLIFGLGGRLVAIGVVLGIAASMALSALVKSQVFSVPLLDPMALGASALLLCAAAGLACLIPARRAARVSPLVALRCD